MSEKKASEIFRCGAPYVARLAPSHTLILCIAPAPLRVLPTVFRRNRLGRQLVLFGNHLGHQLVPYGNRLGRRLVLYGNRLGRRLALNGNHFGCRLVPYGGGRYPPFSQSRFWPLGPVAMCLTQNEDDLINVLLAERIKYSHGSTAAHIANPNGKKRPSKPAKTKI